MRTTTKEGNAMRLYRVRVINFLWGTSRGWLANGNFPMTIRAGIWRNNCFPTEKGAQGSPGRGAGRLFRKGPGRQGEEAARGSGTVPKVSCFWLQVSQTKLWRAGKTNALLSLQDDEDANTGAVESKFWRFSFKEYAHRTMLLMIFGWVQVC